MMNNPLDYNIQELNILKLKKGRLLLAEPFMDDPNFKRSVVLVTEYDENGALGFIVNKPLGLQINEVLKDFPPFDDPVFMGGPVQTDSLFYIHSQGEFIEGSVPLGNNLFWSGNFDQLKALVTNNEIFPHEIKFFVGYSGWDYNQINEEIKSDSWLILENNFDGIERFNEDHLWQSTLQKTGHKHALLASFPEDPSLN